MSFLDHILARARGAAPVAQPLVGPAAWGPVTLMPEPPADLAVDDRMPESPGAPPLVAPVARPQPAAPSPPAQAQPPTRTTSVSPPPAPAVRRGAPSIGPTVSVVPAPRPSATPTPTVSTERRAEQVVRHERVVVDRLERIHEVHVQTRPPATLSSEVVSAAGVTGGPPAASPSPTPSASTSMGTPASPSERPRRPARPVDPTPRIVRPASRPAVSPTSDARARSERVEPATLPTTRISIGRIVVTVPTATTPPTREKRAPTPHVDLDEYLARRERKLR